MSRCSTSLLDRALTALTSMNVTVPQLGVQIIRPARSCRGSVDVTACEARGPRRQQQQRDLAFKQVARRSHSSRPDLLLLITSATLPTERPGCERVGRTLHRVVGSLIRARHELDASPVALEIIQLC
jgi:hypothetical protein